MKNQTNIMSYKTYYFIGIGGIGMSALARYFNHFKKSVYGYDKTPSALTTELDKENIKIHYEDDTTHLEQILKHHTINELLIIYTPAVPINLKEFEFCTLHQLTMLKRSVVLGEISKQFKTIAIAGTHGKTTTSTLVAHILKTANVNFYAFLGGISKNYNTNLILGEAISKETYLVVEADEYDKSFLTLHPHILLITSVDADHLDIYLNEKAMQNTYLEFTDQVQKDGVLIVKNSVDKAIKLHKKRLIYSLNLNTEFEATHIKIEAEKFTFNMKSSLENINDIVMIFPGLHNVENAIAASTVAQQIGVTSNDIKMALHNFSGVSRRFDYRVKQTNCVYIDDYAHHPQELNAAISAVKQLYQNKKITGIFQPHLFTRTRDFMIEFAASLSNLDECILLDIYPARELPIEGITSKALLDKIELQHKMLFTKNQVLEYLKNKTPEVLLTLGAGDIDSLIQPIEKILLSKNIN